MRLSTFLCLAALLAVCSAAGPKDAKAKPAKGATTTTANPDEENDEPFGGIPEACRQPVHEPEGKKPAKDAKAAEPVCTLRKPYYDEQDQANHFCIVCKHNDTASKKPGTGPAAAAASGETEIAKQLSHVVKKQLGKLEEFDDNSGLTIVIHGVEKPINISKALDDPNDDNDATQNMEEVIYVFKNKTVAEQNYKNGEPSGDLEEVECPDCEKHLKELKPQKLTPKQKEDQASKRRDREQKQQQKNQRRGGTTAAPEDEDENEDNADSEDANGGQPRRGSQQQQDARRRQYDDQQRMREYEDQQRRRQPPYAAAAYGQQQSYDDRQRRPAAATSGSGGASTKSVPSACKQEIHFTTEDGICSLHVPQTSELCITCRGERADVYQVLQSLDSLAQRLAPNNYQYLAQNAEIVLVFDPAPRDNRVIDFQREFAQHEPMVQKLEEAFYFFPNQSVTVQKFDDSGRQEALEPFRTYDDYLRRYQREHEQQDNSDRSQEEQQQQQQPSPYPDASRDYNQDYYRREQERIRQQQERERQQQQQSTESVSGRVYPSAARPYDQQAQDDRRREQWEAQQRQQQQQQRIQPTTSAYTPTVYASADYYRTQTTTTTPAYGRTYAYTDRTTQPAYGTMMVSVVTLQPTTTITVTADQYGNVVRPTAYAPYIRPDQRGQKQTMCLVVETTMATPQADQYRGERSPSSPVRPVPYAGQPGIYQRT